jgi:hypothetical protein
MRFRLSPQTISILLAIGGPILASASLGTATNQEKPVYKPMGSEGTIVGTISFVGKPPEPLRIDTSADPVCETVNPDPTTDWVVVTNHKLANVVVYVRGETLNWYSFDAPAPDVTLEHKGCRYVPHVLGMQTQQTLRVLNSIPRLTILTRRRRITANGINLSRRTRPPLSNGLLGPNSSFP